MGSRRNYGARGRGALHLDAALSVGRSRAAVRSYSAPTPGAAHNPPAADAARPRARALRTTRCATLERHCESFRDQDWSNIPSIHSQRSTTSAKIALRSSCRSGRARAGDQFEVEIAATDKLTEASGGFATKLAFRFTEGAASLQRVEAHKPHVRPLVMDPDRVAVDYANVRRVDWSRVRYRRPSQCDGEHHYDPAAMPGLPAHAFFSPLAKSIGMRVQPRQRAS